MNRSINWQQFGLKKNPYDTLPLIEGGDIPINQAFVGREKEKALIDGLIESDDRLCLAVCGGVGVGKTSLINFEKFLWKYTKTEKKYLFSFRREMEANVSLLDKKGFLLEIIGSILREIRLLEPKLFEREQLLQKLSILVDITQTASISFGGSLASVGLNLGSETSTNHPVQLTATILEEFYAQILKFIRTHDIAGMRYSGLIVHVNNFEIVLNSEAEMAKVKQFFNEVRDLLQLPDVYYIFIGPESFFRDVISTIPRVKSIFFQNALSINPLNKSEIIQAFDERMKLLKSDNVKEIIKPVEDELVYKLYDVYNGDIRSIMFALRSILMKGPEIFSRTISVDEGLVLLSSELWDRIKNTTKLSPEQLKVLTYLVDTSRNISQVEAAKILKKQESNISSYYFKPLKMAGIIEEKEIKGKYKYWGLTQEYFPLTYLLNAQKKLTQDLNREIKKGQRTLW